MCVDACGLATSLVPEHARSLADNSSRLLGHGAGAFWSEQSECATLRSWAASVGIEDASCKQLGRWLPSADEGYIRSVRGNVERARKQIASGIRRNFGGIDCLDEDSILMQLESLLRQQSVDEAGAAAQLKLLRCFRPEHALMQDPEFADKPGEIAGSHTEDESLPPLVASFLPESGFKFLGFFLVMPCGEVMSYIAQRRRMS